LFLWLEPGLLGYYQADRITPWEFKLAGVLLKGIALNALSTAPNLLTLLRICLMPFLVAAILEKHFDVGLALFIVAGLTDALDGLLARWLKQKTTLGQYLDPVADKLLLSTLFVVLSHLALIPRTVTIMVISRDVGILIVAALLYAAAGVRNFEPGLFGKASTVAQIACVAFVLFQQVYTAEWVTWSRAAALDATVVLTVLSGLQYAWRAGRRQLPT
jgi:cardiolipin synthase